MRLLTSAALALAVAAPLPAAAIDDLPPDQIAKLQTLYYKRLDDWVAAGGNTDKIQADVVGNCGKLIYTRVPMSRFQSVAGEEKEDIDFRIDVCAKLTVNRAHPQPEFQNPKTRKIVCGDMAGSDPVFAKLCAGAGIKP
jgi:hypothetical protein